MARKAKVNFFYPTYRFRPEEQDPIIDTIQSCLEKENISFAKAATGSGVSATTLYNWFTKRKTKRPQYATVAAVLGYAGYKLVAAKAGPVKGVAQPAVVLKRFPTAREVTKPEVEKVS